MTQQNTQEVWSNVREGLRAFIATRVADESEVDDLLQEVFLRIHRKLDSLNDPQRVVSWVYQITRHVIIDHYRTPERRRELPAGLGADLESRQAPPSQGKDAEDVSQFRTELADCLRPMIAGLAKDYREAVTLVELHGLTQRDAAQRLGLSLSGMKSRVQRGRQQLKQMLNDCCLIQLDRRRAVSGYQRRDPKRSPCADSCR